MNVLYSILLPSVVLLLPCILLISLLHIRKYFIRLKNRKPPFTENFLRSPGQSLIKQIDDVSEEINSSLVLIFILPVMMFFIHISQSYFGNINETTFRTLSGIVITLLFVGYFIRKLWQLLNKRKDLRLGYEGELAVGQELNQLMRNGYHVFHDFPANNFNIDHVIVGPAGVFSVETKTRSKQESGKGLDKAKVVYDGKQLKFPYYNQTEPIDQAKRQAQWISHWLSKATGEKIDAVPVLLIPGWYVERAVQNFLHVNNPKNFLVWINKKQEIKLSKSLITQIAHQLEQKCRDVEPMTNKEVSKN